MWFSGHKKIVMLAWIHAIISIGKQAKKVEQKMAGVFGILKWKERDAYA